MRSCIDPTTESKKPRREPSKLEELDTRFFSGYEPLRLINAPNSTPTPSAIASDW